MNEVRVSGLVLGDSELRTLTSGRELLNFDVSVDGPRGRDPIVRCGYFPRGNGDIRKIGAGRHVLVIGALRYRMDYSLFVAASNVSLLDKAVPSDLPADVDLEKNWTEHLHLGEPGARR